VASRAREKPMQIKPKSKLVMIGDSITDCERARPVGEGLFGAIGKSYVSLVSGLIHSTYPGCGIRVVNMGCSGNTVRDLKNRWQTDVLDLRPAWVSIMIGINDVWRQFDMPMQSEVHVPLAEYEETLEALVAKTLPAVRGLVLMTPFYIESNRKDAMRARMDRYGAAVKRLAQKHKTFFVDTQAAFDRVLKHGHSAELAWDRVHPTITGHMLLAREFLHAVGYRW
jgi:lysophospholipase L1-like esterase